MDIEIPPLQILRKTRRKTPQLLSRFIDPTSEIFLRGINTSCAPTHTTHSSHRPRTINARRPQINKAVNNSSSCNDISERRRNRACPVGFGWRRRRAYCYCTTHMNTRVCVCYVELGPAANLQPRARVQRSRKSADVATDQHNTQLQQISCLRPRIKATRTQCSRRRHH